MGNSPVTGEFPAQNDSNAEQISIWWRHHDIELCYGMTTLNFAPSFKYLICCIVCLFENDVH